MAIFSARKLLLAVSIVISLFGVATWATAQTTPFDGNGGNQPQSLGKAPPPDQTATTAAKSDDKKDVFQKPPELRSEIANGNCSSVTPLNYCAVPAQPDTLYVSTEALFLHLNRPANQPVALNNGTGETVLSTTSQNPGFSAGLRLILGYRINDVSTVEATYFGLDHWIAKASAVGATNLQVPGDLAGATTDFNGSNSMTTTYKTSMYNAELNYLHATDAPGLSVLGGFRYLNLHDFYNINSYISDAEQSDYRIRTQNNLLGGQLGLRLNRQWGAWGAGVTGKVGVMGNMAQQKTFVGDNNNGTVLRDSSTSGTSTSFIGDINPNISYRLNSNWNVRAGADFIWVTGVARAPNQLDFTNNPDSGMSLSQRSNLFLYGANCGFEATW